MTDNSTDLKALAKTLPDSYSALLQYSTLSQDSIDHHLTQLAKYSDHLPLSWFTPALIEALLALSDRKPTSAAIYTLWTVWVRRLSGSPDAIPSVEPQLTKVLMALEKALLSPSTTPLPIRKESLIGLVALAGRAPGSFSDTRMIEALNKILAVAQTDEAEDVEAISETMDAGVAHCLAETSLLNVFEAEHCEKLLEGYVGFAARRRTSGPVAAMTVMQHVVDVRAQLRPQTRADADLTALVELVVKDRQGSLAVQLVWLGILAGVVRMFQFAKDKSKKMNGLHEQMDKELVKRFDALVTKVMAKEHAYDFAINQDIIAYIAGQCLPNLPADAIKDMDHKSVLRVLVSCLLTSEHIWRSGQIITQLKNTQACVDDLNELANGLVYKDIGRISRAIGAVITTGLSTDSDDSMGTAVQASLDRLVGFSYNIFIDWDRFLRNHPEGHMDTASARVFKDLHTAIWLMFKTMMFSFTAILKAVAVDIPNGEGLVNVRHAAQDILAVYANLQFITDHLGSGSGFKAYQDTLTNAVAYLTHEEGACQLNNMLSTAYREYGPSKFTTDQTHPTAVLSQVQLSRITFFTNLTEQVMAHIDDNVLENDILPVIYPVLKWTKPESKDMYESAHAAILAVFSAKKDVSREVGGIYAKILIDSFPEPMSLHQLRFAYTTMIQSLCLMDDAISWLAANSLLDKVHSLAQDEKDLVLLSQYATVLIDLLKPLSLGPFYGQFLQEIEKLVLLPNLTIDMREAMLKIIFETVSGSGISDMRRVDAVGWFLELKRKVTAAPGSGTKTGKTTQDLQV